MLREACATDVGQPTLQHGSHLWHRRAFSRKELRASAWRASRFPRDRDQPREAPVLASAGDVSSVPRRTKEELELLRHNCHDWPAISDVDAALDLVTRLGAASTWSSIGTLPSLARSLAPGADHQIVWQAQEDISKRRSGYYGKVLSGKGTMLSSAVYQDLAIVAGGLDHQARHSSGRLSADAKLIADRIAAAGPASTDKLRSDLGYSSGSPGKAFGAAMTELQQQLLITAVDQVPGNGNFKTPVWQLSSEWWPELADIPVPAALRNVVSQLAAAAGVFLDSDFRSWLRPYGTNPGTVINELAQTGRIVLIGKVGNGQLYIHQPKHHVIE
jgi:hypothetical protein